MDGLPVPFSHPPAVRQLAVSRVLEGARPVMVAQDLSLSPQTVYSWLHADAPAAVSRPAPCCRCAGPAAAPPDRGAYAQLLGLYLGDGCVSRSSGVWSLRITCDDHWPGLQDEAAHLVAAVSGRRVQRVRKDGCHDIQAWWQHWPCLLPQCGSGKKHDRPIVLESWQREIVAGHPGRLLRGLFHSDGWRGENVAVHRKNGAVTRYRYPRYQFTNLSADIRGICTDALDELGIAWRPVGRSVISVARRQAVAALDEHVGPKC